jgi:hypothetical protein
VHGFVLEFLDGTRSGVLLDNDGDMLDLDNDASLLDRSKEYTEGWIPVPVLGDYIVGVSGFQLNHGENYVCHSVVLQFASTHQPWRGVEFRYNRCDSAPFREQADLSPLTSVHLPVHRSIAEHLPPDVKTNLMLIFQIAERVDEYLIAGACESQIADEVWWSILGYLTGYDLVGV